MPDTRPLPVFPVLYPPRVPPARGEAPRRGQAARVTLAAALVLYVVQLALVLSWVAGL